MSNAFAELRNQNNAMLATHQAISEVLYPLMLMKTVTINLLNATGSIKTENSPLCDL